MCCSSFWPRASKACRKVKLTPLYHGVILKILQLLLFNNYNELNIRISYISAGFLTVKCSHSISSDLTGSLSGIIDLFSLSRDNALRMSRKNMVLVLTETVVALFWVSYAVVQRKNVVRV